MNPFVPDGYVTWDKAIASAMKYWFAGEIAEASAAAERAMAAQGYGNAKLAMALSLKGRHDEMELTLRFQTVQRLRNHLYQGKLLKAYYPGDDGRIQHFEPPFWVTAYANRVLESGRLWLRQAELDALLSHRSRSDETGASSVAKHPGGALPKFDWQAIEAALEAECKLHASVPRRGHSDRDWRSKVDAYRFVREHLNLKDGGPSETALKENVGPMLERIEARLKKGGN